MNTDTYEQITLPEDLLDEEMKYVRENMEVEVVFHDKEVLGVEAPTFVELEVVQTDPGVRGDTATGGSKPATLKTGAVAERRTGEARYVPLLGQAEDFDRVG